MRRLMTAGSQSVGGIDQILDDVGIPQPFGIVSFVDAVARMRKRRLELVRTRSADGPCGLLVSTSIADYVFFDGASPLHRTHNILHEIGHLLLGHRLVSVDVVRGHGASVAKQQPSSWEPPVAASFVHSDVDEADADHFAAVVLVRATAQAGLDGRPAPGLSSVFAGSQTGWDWSPGRGAIRNGIRAVLTEAGARTVGPVIWRA